MKYSSLLKFLFVACFAISGSALAVDFNVVALFPGKAMIETGDNRLFLNAGEEKKGFLLISTDPYKQLAVIEIDGKKDTYTLGRHIGGGYTKPQVKEVRVNSNRLGSFISSGQINGQNVNFLLDTGATSVSMNENLAKRLNLDFMKESQKAMVATAAGLRVAYRTILEKVTLGGITLYNVEGLVLKGNSPEITLLGMSFLGQLEIEQREKLMVLRKKF